jgi:hypothetical protein
LPNKYDPHSNRLVFLYKNILAILGMLFALIKNESFNVLFHTSSFRMGRQGPFKMEAFQSGFQLASFSRGWLIPCEPPHFFISEYSVRLNHFPKA